MKLMSLGNDKFYVCKETCNACKKSCDKQSINEQALEEIKNRLPINALGIDIGAHIGIWSMLLKDKIIKMDSYEPEINAFNTLKENSKMYRNINPFNIPIWGKQTNLFVIKEKNNKTEQCYVYDFKPTEKDLHYQFDIIGGNKANTVDNMYKDKFIDFIKIDAEGAEIDILEGAQETLKKNKAIIFIEYCKLALIEHKRTPNRFFELLERCGYYISYDEKKDLLNKEDNFITNLLLYK